MMQPVGEHNAGDRMGNAAHRLHALRGQADLVADGRAATRLQQRDIAFLHGIGVVERDDAVRRGEGPERLVPVMLVEQPRRLVPQAQDVLDQRLPRYKMYLFLNAFQLGPQTIDKITQSFKGNPLVVWFGAPGALGITINGRQVRQLTGISVSPWRNSLSGMPRSAIAT